MSRTIVQSSLTLALVALAAGSVIALHGCAAQEAVAQGGGARPGGATAAARAGGGAQLDLDVPGVPVSQSSDQASMIQRVVASRSFGARPDPFALFPVERQFENAQRVEALVQSSGGFSMEYVPPPPADEVEVLEPQPYRRLAGILIGETVAAIIVMENGTHIIKPGMQIPNTEWTVVSIDQNKAILRRPGNKRPNQVTVRLESPPGGVRPGGGRSGGGPGQGQGAPGGGGQPGTVGVG